MSIYKEPMTTGEAECLFRNIGRQNYIAQIEGLNYNDLCIEAGIPQSLINEYKPTRAELLELILA